MMEPSRANATSPVPGLRVGEFGNKFRTEREKKGFSLDDVSNVTKIGSRMLQAIEEEHFDQLPGGVFNKGFIRAYAKHLGLNDEEAVTDYLACLRQAQIDAQEVWERVRPAQRRPAPPEKRPPVAAPKPTLNPHTPAQVEELPELQLPRAQDVRRPRKNYGASGDNGIPWRIVAVAAVVLVLAAVLWNRHAHSGRSEAASSAKPVPMTPPAPAPVIAPPPASAPPSAHPSTLTQPSSAKQPATRPPAQAKRSAPNNATPPSPEPAQREPSAKPAAPLNLVVRASETSWISVIADGQPVSEETLIAPAHTSVRATREIVVKVGNAAGVTFLWNGKEIPTQGGEAEVKTLVFDASGMRVLSTGPSPDQNQ